MNLINNFTKPLQFLVGMNGSGKTYALNKALKEQEQWAFLIAEDGMPIIPRHLNKIFINFESMLYSYLDEDSRGQSRNATEEENISERVRSVILFCSDIMRKLNLFKVKSKGQEKLYNMVEIFTNYNLNNIKIIYFDEPENFLDEEFLKVIAEFLKLLVDSGFIVRVATHNSRLLNILKINLEDIIFFNAHSQFHVLNGQVTELFCKTSEEIETIREGQALLVDATIKYKLNLPAYPHAFASFKEQSLQSEEFYRCLFYKKIIIVEGDSDIVALSSMKHDFESSVEFFNPNGKAFIPFFVRLFLHFKKEIIVIIDEDNLVHESDSPLKHPFAITHLLRESENRNEIKLVVHSPDLEGFYNINLDQIGNSLEMSNAVRRNRGWLKSLGAFIFFSEETNRNRLKRHIFGLNEEVEFEFK
jgi:ABC-type ATPase involved in cell division